ncbi:hypothetical protein ASE17_20085 [Phenylobacterium sp. Root77]|jgi:uncharacterized membrane protein|nr:hypothetical protein ASC73_17520 [Phenylobacterium sp. Root1277]KQW89631.1 hypothetical protein ASC79_18425 [Phenylobacterium sp. Root1290]KRC43500.1 hypothetical protein ASE17_20085 [Phenylobacterium sp. Root77]
MPERRTHDFETVSRPMLHPLHAILLAFPIALFTGALVSDIAYLRTAELQWSNFAAWMITGALVVGAMVLLWALVSAVLARRAGRVRAGGYLLLIVIMWGAGLVNAFQHSRDGWSSVGALGLLLSLTSMLAALLAGWIGFSAARRIAR